MKIYISRRHTQTCADNKDFLPGRLAQAKYHAFQANMLNPFAKRLHLFPPHVAEENVRVRLCVSSEQSERAANKKCLSKIGKQSS